MADTFDSRLKLRLQESGANSGQWGTLLNQTITNIASVFGFGTHQLTSDADATLTLSDDGASLDALKSSYLKITSSVSLTATRTLTFAPNTFNQVKYIENATTGSQSLVIKQGSGATVTVASGKTAVVYFTGSGSGAAVVDALAGVDPGVTDTLAEVLSAGNATGGTDIAVGTGDDITFADSSKAIFGAGSDLQIYHDGGFSYIREVGTGDLRIAGASNVQIWNSDIDSQMANFTNGGAATLYHSGSAKLATTSSGIDVTGSVTASGVTVGNSNLGSNTSHLANITINNNGYIGSSSATTALQIQTSGNAVFSGNVGIGGAPDTDVALHLKGDGQRFLIDSDDENIVSLGRRSSSGAGLDQGYFRLRNSGTNAVVIDTAGDSYFNGGDVGIGTSSPVGPLTTSIGAGSAGSLNNQISMTHSGASTAFHLKTIRASANDEPDGLAFIQNTSEAMRISSGNILKVNTTATNANISVATPKVITDNSFGVNTGSNIAAYSHDRINFDSANYFVLNAASTGVKLVNGQTSWTTQSDENLKENITELDGVLSKIKGIRCVTYNLKTQTASDKTIGFIAQDWQADFEETVNEDPADGTLGMKYSETIPVLMKAIQEQQTLIETLTDRIAALESN